MEGAMKVLKLLLIIGLMTSVSCASKQSEAPPDVVEAADDPNSMPELPSTDTSEADLNPGAANPETPATPTTPAEPNPTAGDQTAALDAPSSADQLDSTAQSPPAPGPQAP